MTTLWLSLGAAFTVIAGLIGAWFHGKSTGAAKANAENETVNLKNETESLNKIAESKKVNNEIISKVNNDVSALPSGSSADKLREKYSRD